MPWFHRGVLQPFRRSWHARCHTWNAKVPKGSLLVCQGAMFMRGRLLTLKREPEWGCDACWLLAAIMPGSATHVASGSGQVSKKVQLWLAADSCLKTTGHVSQVPCHKCHRCHRWHMWRCHDYGTSMEFTMCALHCAISPRATNHLGWCDHAS